jgi:hypothetical protein
MGPGAVDGADATFVVALEGGNVEAFRGQTLLDFQDGGFDRNGIGGTVFARSRSRSRSRSGCGTNKNAAQQETH